MSRRAVFLDRDGTINVDVGYPSRWDQIAIYPYAFDAVRRLKAAGILRRRRDQPIGDRPRAS